MRVKTEIMDTIQKIVKWSEAEEAIKVLLLQGSRAGKIPADELSDYDISVFCNTSEPYTETEEWLAKIGQVWVCVKEKISFNGRTFPSRLVIFEDGIKVDFSFFSLDILEGIIHSHLPEDYNRGYQILLDKGNLTHGLQKANFNEPRAIKPSAQEFLEVIQEFWFEAYHVAIYLKREDLWSVKFRSAAMQAFLLRMIEWDAQAQNGWNHTTPPIGKRMASWVDKTIWKSLHEVFAHFEAEDSWKALLHTLTFFRRLSVGVADQLGFDYPESLDKNISRFILEVRERKLGK